MPQGIGSRLRLHRVCVDYEGLSLVYEIRLCRVAFKREEEMVYLVLCFMEV